MKLILFSSYYFKLRLSILLDIFETAHPLDLRWRWKYWNSKYSRGRYTRLS